MRSTSLLILVLMLGLVALAGAGCSFLASGPAPATATRVPQPSATAAQGVQVATATAPAAVTPQVTAPPVPPTSSPATQVPPPTLGSALAATPTLGTGQRTATVAATAAGQRTPTGAATSAPGQRTATVAATGQRTGTVAATSPTPQRTATRAPTSAGAQATPPAGGTCTYRATFIGDMTVPDYTVVPAGSSFVKTWRLRNDGTCSWGTGGFAVHRLVFVSGDKLGAPDSVELPVAEVKPGAVVDVSVNMTAPSSSGVFKGNWMLGIENDGTLGVGYSGTTPIYVQITVRGGTPGATPPPSASPAPTGTIQSPSPSGGKG